MVATTIHPEALEELAQAIAFYEARASGVGRSFFDEVQRALELMGESPMAGVEIEAPFRRVLVPQFPFSIVYRRTSRGVRVLAIMHQRRRPGYWRGRT